MLIQTPPQFGGDERQQLVQVRSYLYQLAETLNQNLNNLSLDNFRPDAKQTITAVAEDSEKTIQQNAQALKALIVKTASVIEAQIDEISTKLETNYVAQSEFGTYTKQAEAQITANAEGITQNYERVEHITGQFDEYVLTTSGYIRTGITIVEEDGTEAVGIEIGDLNGDSPMKATFTSEKLAFWQNGVQVAWISNGQWSANAIDIKDMITLGSWQISKTNGFSIRWVG